MSSTGTETLPPAAMHPGTTGNTAAAESSSSAGAAMYTSVKQQAPSTTATTNPLDTPLLHQTTQREGNAMPIGAEGQDSIPVAVPVYSRTYHSSLAQPTQATRAQFLIGSDPEIAQLQRANQDLSGFGLMGIRAGTMELGGPVVVPRKLDLFAVCHGAKLDFSQATFVHAVTTINIFCICGGVNVTIPRGVRVQTNGLAICGAIAGLDDYGRQANTAVLESPLLVIEGFTMCGGTSVELNLAVEPLVIIQHQHTGI